MSPIKEAVLGGASGRGINRRAHCYSRELMSAICARNPERYKRYREKLRYIAGCANYCNAIRREAHKRLLAVDKVLYISTIANMR